MKWRVGRLLKRLSLIFCQNGDRRLGNGDDDVGDDGDRDSAMAACRDCVDGSLGMREMRAELARTVMFRLG